MQSIFQRTLTVRRFFLLACGLILHACTQQISKPTEQQDPEIAYEVRQERVGQIKQWSLHSRIAIQTEQDANTGNLHWVQNAQSVELDLKGPFGVNVAKIKGINGEYTLQDRQGDIWQADNINQLIYNRTGWALPIEQLRYWILADIQNKNNATVVKNIDGTLAALGFEQWQITYEKYMLVEDIQLPVKIHIMHPDISIKLLIRQWNINNG